MATILYLLRSDNCPDFGPDTEAIVIADEDSPPPDGGTEAYACLTTVVSNQDDSPDFRAMVTDWWKERGGAEPELEVLATDPSMMSPDQRDSLAELDPSTWSVRSNIVLFPRDSAELEAEARKIVVEAALDASSPQSAVPGGSPKPGREASVAGTNRRTDSIIVVVLAVLLITGAVLWLYHPVKPRGLSGWVLLFVLGIPTWFLLEWIGGRVLEARIFSRLSSAGRIALAVPVLIALMVVAAYIVGLGRRAIGSP